MESKDRTVEAVKQAKAALEREIEAFMQDVLHRFQAEWGVGVSEVSVWLVPMSEMGRGHAHYVVQEVTIVLDI